MPLVTSKSASSNSCTSQQRSIALSTAVRMSQTITTSTLTIRAPHQFLGQIVFPIQQFPQLLLGVVTFFGCNKWNQTQSCNSNNSTKVSMIPQPIQKLNLSCKSLVVITTITPGSHFFVKLYTFATLMDSMDCAVDIMQLIIL